MINTWGELLTAIKTWWTTELKFERKPKEPTVTTTEFPDLLRPTMRNLPRGDYYTSTEDWNKIQRAGLQHMSELYFNALRDRLRHGEHLSTEELYRLRMQDRLHDFNDALDNLPDQDNNLPPVDKNLPEPPPNIHTEEGL